LSSTLHPIERKVLAALRGKGWIDFDSLATSSGLSPDQVRRSLAWLTTKGLAESNDSVSTRLVVNEKNPPELKMAARLSSGPVDLEQLKSSFASEQEFSAALGRARGSGWIAFEQSDGSTLVRLSDAKGPTGLSELMIAIEKGADESSLSQVQAQALTDLLRRGLVSRESTKTVVVKATDSGEKVELEEPHGEYVERLSPESLATGSWKGKQLRPIDVEAPAARLPMGRRHPVRDFIREVREVYISMGFTELDGESVQPSFWNFDALFIPQNHPGREMQDTFYLAGLRDSTLERTGVVARVASTHEGGWKTGSRGWGYRWSTDEARRLVLRTHNTVLTVRALSESGDKEARVFAVSKVYRNESLDYKHIAEFYQMDGIIVGEGLNVRHLKGFLTEFYKKLGMKDVKLWPTYFPYTEPSLQVMGYSNMAKDWIELGGSGVFRPEVTKPLGVEVPVLAWGPGIERLMLLKFKLDDIRDLYSGDLGWLRNRVEYASRRA